MDRNQALTFYQSLDEGEKWAIRQFLTLASVEGESSALAMTRSMDRYWEENQITNGRGYADILKADPEHVRYDQILKRAENHLLRIRAQIDNTPCSNLLIGGEVKSVKLLERLDLYVRVNINVYISTPFLNRDLCKLIGEMEGGTIVVKRVDDGEVAVLTTDQVSYPFWTDFPLKREEGADGHAIRS